MTGKATAEFSREFIAHALREIGDAEIPKGAEVVGLEYNAERDLYECVLASDDLPETLEGAVVPTLQEANNE